MPYSSPLPPRSPISPSSPTPSSDHTAELSDSFILVSNDEDAETESNSTISTALLAELSDTSSEPRYAGSLEGSFHGELSEAEYDLDSVQHEAEDDLGGSYADAEATASLLTDSRSTFSPRSLPDWSPPGATAPRPTMDRAAGSQFRFIFPCPEASFSSSAVPSDGTTPTASLANLLPPHSLTRDHPSETRRLTIGLPINEKRERASSRGVEEDWLKDARTWVSELRPVSPDGHERAALWPDAEHTALANSAGKIDSGGGRVVVERPETKQVKITTKPVNSTERRGEVARVLRMMVSATVDTANKRWGLIAVASCALAILSAIGPTVNYLSAPRPIGVRVNATSTSSMYTVPPKAMSNLDDAPAATVSPSSSASMTYTSRSIATQLISDLQLIRNAISTFTLGPDKQEPPIPEYAHSTANAMTTTRTPSPRIKREDAVIVAGSTLCCSDTLRPSHVALTIPASPNRELSIFDDSGYKAWMKAMANKVMQPTSSPSPPNEQNSSTTDDPCTCGPSTHLIHRYGYLIQRAQDYAAATVSAAGQLYQPMLRHLDYELGEIYRLSSLIAHSTTTRSILHNVQLASQGAQSLLRSIVDIHECRKAHQLVQLRLVQQYILASWKNITMWASSRPDKVAGESVQRARAGLVRLSGQVEARKAEIQAKGGRSVRQAKKGLNRLLDKRKDTSSPVPAGNGVAKTDTEVKGVMEDVVVQVDAAGDASGGRFYRSGRLPRERRSRSSWRTRGDTTRPRINSGEQEQPRAPTAGRLRRRWRSLLQAVHHGAVQVVLHQ